MITGDSSHEQNKWSMECFNNSLDAKVFFVSIKAHGEGFSLLGALRIIIFDARSLCHINRQKVYAI